MGGSGWNVAWSRVAPMMRDPEPLRDGVLREPSDLGRPEGQHDPILGDAGLDQLLGDSMFGAVALDPELAVDDVEVDQAPMDPLADELANRLHKVIDFGVPQEALDLHGNPPVAFLGGQVLLGTQVNVQVFPSPWQAERVVGDDPPVL